MASKSLGTLTVDLIARVGGFVSGISKAEREYQKTSRSLAKEGQTAAKQMERAQKRLTEAAARSTDSMSREMTRAMREYQKAQKRMQEEARRTQEEMQRAADEKHTTRWVNIGRAGAAAFTAIAASALYFARNTMEATNVQAQLEAVIRSTGNASGQTAEQLDRMSTSMARAGVASKNEITDAQTTLLAFTNITGEQFPRAMQGVMDMAARTGMSVRQAAELMGRSLEYPTQGLSSLTDQGFRFGEEQKTLIKALEETGQYAAAQTIILEALEESYYGSAEAARDTLSGALKALREELKLTMTGDEGSVGGLTVLINDMTEAMQSSSTKAAFDRLSSWFGGFRDAALTSIDTVRTAMAALINFIASSWSVVTSAPGIWLQQAREIVSGNIKGATKITRDWWQGEVAKFKGGMTVVGEEITNGVLERSKQVSREIKADAKQTAEEMTDHAKIARHNFDKIMGDANRGTKKDPEYARQVQVIEDAMKQGTITADEYREALDHVEKKFSPREARSGGRSRGRTGKTDEEKAAEAALRRQQQLIEQYDQTILGYEEAAFMLGKEGEAAQALWDIERGRFSELDEARKKELVQQAAILDQRRKEQEANENFRSYMKDYEEYIADIEFQNELLGKTRNEQELLILARQLELEIQERSVDLDEEQIEKLREKKDAILDMIRAQQEMSDAMRDQIAVMDEIRHQMSRGLSDFIDGTKSFKDAFMGALDAINKRILDMISDKLIEQLLGGFGTTGQGSAGGNWMSGLFGAMFGGTGKANGGHLSAGAFSRVNERGPEMLTTSSGKQYLMLGDSSATVTPNHMLNTGGGIQQTNNFVIEGKIDRRTQNQIVQEVSRRTNTAQSRG